MVYLKKVYITFVRTNVRVQALGISDTRTVLKTGKYSKAVTIPSKIKTGETATIAGNRLIIMDPRGEIPESDLLEFLEAYIEPNFWNWIQTKTFRKKRPQTAPRGVTKR